MYAHVHRESELKGKKTTFYSSIKCVIIPTIII